MTARVSVVAAIVVLIGLWWACAEFTVVTGPDTSAADSIDVYPDSVTLEVGDTVQLTAVVYAGDSIVECSGACDTVPGISADQVVPFQKIARIE